MSKEFEWKVSEDEEFIIRHIINELKAAFASKDAAARKLNELDDFVKQHFMHDFEFANALRKNPNTDFVVEENGRTISVKVFVEDEANT